MGSRLKHFASLSWFVETLNRYIGGGRKRGIGVKSKHLTLAHSAWAQSNQRATNFAADLFDKLKAGSAAATAVQLMLGTGVALVIAVVFYFLALSEGPTSVVVPIYGMFIVGGAVLGLVFLHEPLTLRKALGILLAAVSIYLIAGHPAPWCDEGLSVETLICESLYRRSLRLTQPALQRPDGEHSEADRCWNSFTGHVDSCAPAELCLDHSHRPVLAPATILLIPGTSSMEHLRENVAGAGLQLPHEAIKELNATAG
jgi:multidrug transporter EmrE-like cation transporter